jgi:RimJ/RimL family protein N-acetyltransferase
MRYWLGGPDTSIHVTEQRIEEMEQHWKAHGVGDWGLVEQQTDRVIGFSGLHHITDRPDVNIGYALERPYWRQGLASEACQAVLWYGFQQWHFSTIVAVIWPENAASIHCAQKLGLRYWKALQWQGGARVVYRIDRDDYRSEGFSWCQYSL